MNKVIIDETDVSECEHYRAEIETKMPYGEYEILKDKCHYSGIEVIQNCKGNKGCIYKQLKRLEQVRNEWKKKYEYAANENLLEIYELIKKNDAWRGIVNVVNGKLEQENEQLKKSIDRIMQNKEIKTIDSEIALLNAELQQENKRLIARLRPLEDSYFKGLSSIEIAGLAKKSIRITAENRKLEDALQEIRDIAGSIIGNANATYTDFYNKLSDILNKINEVIGAE